MRTMWIAGALVVVLACAFWSVTSVPLLALADQTARVQPPPQPPPGDPPPTGDTADQDQPGGRGGAPQSRDPQPRPYDRVITKDAKSDEGVFTVHRIRERVYYEIPKEQLGKEFLWVTQIAKTTVGQGQGGQALGNRVVKWARRDNRVLLKNVAFDIVADPTLPIA